MSRTKQPPLPAPYEVRTTAAGGGPRPRVLHAIANFYIGGSAQLVVDLVERLGDRFDQRVIARDLPPKPAYVDIELAHYPEMSDEIAAELLDRVRPDLLHIHFLGHHGNPYSERDWQWYDTLLRAAGTRWPIVENLNIPVEPYVSPAISRYVYVSDYVRERFGGDAPGLTIYPGSDLERFSRRNPDTEGPDPNLIGMTYRLQEDKLNEASMDPFVLVARRRPATKTLIVGGGPFYADYTARIEREGLSEQFEFTGFVPYRDLPALISRMSVFVAPVHWESFGQVSVFAMGLGMPVAGYDVGGLPEILGGRELLAPPGDAEALAALITGLLDDDERRREIGLANRERAVERFSVERMVERYEDVYTELLE